MLFIIKKCLTGLFPIATVTNYHKFSTSKQHNALSSVLEIRCQKRVSLTQNQVSVGFCSFLETLGENLFSCLVQLPEASHIPWLLVCPFLLKASNDWWSFSNHITLMFSFTFKYPYNYTGLTLIIQDNLSISR